MFCDGHVHLREGEVKRAEFEVTLREARASAAVIISMAPACFQTPGHEYSNKYRLSNLYEWCGDNPSLYRFHWIDPTEADAAEQVYEALRQGIDGFKVICGRHYPGDERAMKIYQQIADAGKPMLFHSGILWDGRPSSRYNRPVEFEALLDIKGLRFALAHVSWPWHDECVALFGKFLNAKSIYPDLTAEMFVDLTPGTPPIYREEVLKKLLMSEYAAENSIIFGTDCYANDYSKEWAFEWVNRDTEIYNRIGIGKETREKIFSGNLMRFLGKKQ